jgi:hypothetical protein
MSTYKRTENMENVIAAMAKVQEKLIAHKRKMNSIIVVLDGDKVKRLNP